MIIFFFRFLWNLNKKDSFESVIYEKNQFYLYLEFYIYFLKVYGQCPLFFCTDICSLGLNFLEFLGVSFMDPDPNFPGWIPMFG